MHPLFKAVRIQVKKNAVYLLGMTKLAGSDHQQQ
jgi:hypothetical protein